MAADGNNRLIFRIRLHPQGNKESNKDFCFFQVHFLVKLGSLAKRKRINTSWKNRWFMFSSVWFLLAGDYPIVSFHVIIRSTRS